jgi:chromosome segregation ATPase
MKGLVPSVETRPLWPEGKALVASLRATSDGSAALRKQLAALNRDLPRLRTSVQDARRVVDRASAALAGAAAREERLQALLMTPPDQVARLLDQAAALQDDLAAALRGAKQLRSVAAALRDMRQRVGEAAVRAPKVRDGLLNLADLLRKRQLDLQELIDNPGPYRASLDRTLTLIDAVTASLPLFTDHLDTKLEEEEQSLERLENSINEVTEVVPEMAQTASRLLQLTKLLLYLGAGIFGLHGVYLVCNAHRQGEKT